MTFESASTTNQSAAIRAVVRLVQVYARTPRPVVFTGLTGTGKGYFAQMLHHLSAVPGPMVVLTGGQLTETLLHTQLFGHVSGAFTGAIRSAKGAFEQASHGTLFLDEMQHWTVPVQSALLQVLEEGRIRPLGAERELPTTCRLIFAATMSVDELMRDGYLLPDLRWRLAFLEIPVPALSARCSDILPLADRFLEAARSDFQIDRELSWGPDAVSALLAYTWPGNIRELRGVVEHGALHCAAGGRLTIVLADLPKQLHGEYPPLRECSPEVRQAAVAWMLAKVQGNHSEAARRLGLHRNTIARRASARDPELPSSQEP